MIDIPDFGLGASTAPPPTLPPTPMPRQITAASLSELNLDEELLIQYQNAVSTFESIRYDEETPANQKAQILNTISAILTNIVKLQTEMYDAERLKKLESALITILQGFPDIKEAFLQAYEKALAQ